MRFQKDKLFTIIFVVIFVALPFIIVDKNNDFFEKQFGIITLINLASFFLIIQFLNILRIGFKFKNILLFALIAWFCILPVIFYKIYLNNPQSFTYKKEYLVFLKNQNENNFTRSDSNFIKLNSDFKALINEDISKVNLPNKDKVIIYKNYIIFSPERIYGSNGLPPPKTYIKVFNKNNGNLMYKFEKKKNLFESYKSFHDNLDFKNNIVEKPEKGINYFDFWCSSIIGFRDNLITPLRGWIFVLNFLFITILFVPLYNYIQNKFFKEKKED